MARSMVSLGMFTPRALSTAARRRGFPPGSPPPTRAETVNSLMTFVQSLDLFESEASFLCLILVHRLCPDMPPIIAMASPPAASFFLPHGGPSPGVGGSGVRFQPAGPSQALWTRRWTDLPFQLPAETETAPP